MPSRLIGMEVDVRVYAAHIEVVRAKRTTPATTASGVALAGLRLCDREQRRLRLVWRVVTPVSVAAWSSVMCSASKLFRT